LQSSFGINAPYIVLVLFGYDGKCLYIHTANEGKNNDCLESNNQVCFEFDINIKTIDNELVACSGQPSVKVLLALEK
jgi:uncharacterized protein